ncbi:MAG: HDOD domain-containing protein [Ghiorsea sp.]
MSENISSEMQEKIIAMVDAMPAFPQSVHKVLNLTADINCSPKDVIQAIEHDPVMTAKMLKLVNSAFYSLPRKITSMKHAVVYIGINTVKNLALSIATVGMLPAHNKADFDMPDFLLHSLATASIARKLAEMVPRQGFDAVDFFVAGLLHDFGKVVLVRSMPNEFALALAKAKDEGISLVLAEKEVMGIDHCHVGGVLGEKWKFPDGLVQAIREHHRVDLASNVLRDCVFVSNQICKQMEVGDAGNTVVEPLSDAMVQLFGGDLEHVIGKLGDLESTIADAKVFASL